MAEEKSINIVEDGLAWFAMSATFGRELKAKTFFESKDVTCFVPMRYEVVKDRKRDKVRKLVSAINNLIFVYTTKERIQSLKAELTYLQYLTRPVNGRNVPIIVPEYQMRQFISICETQNESLQYISVSEINLEKGTRVRIVGGAFDGVEGVFVKVSGKRKKHVVVLIQDIAAVAVAELTDGYLKVLE
ncbi:MAG: UpxY family transcription antiterminator [Bacteroidales bacterium]|nr:UpxY family transcription antiterminator [Bacteroidales bacterium]